MTNMPTLAVVNAHITITHQDIHIFTGHRAYIDGMEAYSVAADVVWEHVGHTNEVSGVTAINGQLFAATKDNKLWKRDPLPL